MPAKEKAAKSSNPLAAFKNNNIHNHMNVSKIISPCARPTGRTARFHANLCTGMSNKKNTALWGCDTFQPSPNCGAGAENTVIDSGVHTATLSAVFSRSEFMVLGVKVLPIRKDGSMAESMFSPPSRPSCVPEKRIGWFFQTHSGAETMTNVITMASRKASPFTASTATTTTPVLGIMERQQAIENALSMALYHVRHCDSLHGLQAATSRAIRAASMLKQACAESITSGRV